MITGEQYRALDATAMADMVAKGDVSPSELVDAALAEATRQNGSLNAIVIPMDAIGLQRARETLSGPFAGVPMLLKDLAQDYAGVPTAGGNEAYKRAGYTPSEHSEIVRRFLDAGVVVVGRTNTPEFGARGVTEPDAWGPARNPYDLNRSPGGSSGGSAAAVAAGIVPIAGANDGGGSIRIPASCTGLFGFKPSRGRSPTGPKLAELLHGAGQNHVLTRSVRDSARMLDAVHGPEFGSRSLFPAEGQTFAEMAERDPKKLRVAFSAQSPLGTEVDSEVVDALGQTTELLESLGHSVEEAAPAIDGQAMIQDFIHLWFARLGATLKETRRQFPDYPWAFETDSLVIEAVSDRRSGPSYNAAYDRWLEYARQYDEFIDGYDIFLTPTMAKRPPAIGEAAAPAWSKPLVRKGFPLGLKRLVGLFGSVIERVSMDNLASVPFTQLANVTGVPAMSVPLHTFADGLPLGIQAMGRFGGEGTLIGLAGQLERTAPWASRRPNIAE